ncbi:MAG: 6-phosphofructokinase [Candidatus Hydrogenedentes bacterium]|nr:6-phosphofructokinase [Candidatus Hydrogenedentota bacterium]
MREIIPGNVLVAQGGGPTAVINQSLAGVVVESRKFPQIGHVYGALQGVRGIVNEELLDLTEATTHNLEAAALTPAAALLSTRDKPDDAYCGRIFEVLRKHGVRYFFYIGGNDSAETCSIVNKQAAHDNYELRVVHIPKTIDNDLLVTDHCPGYGSAARFVALAFAGANLDNQALPGVYIGVVMGRDAGFLTAASCLARTYPDDGPHLIYLPERAFDERRFVADVKAVHDRHKRCVVAVSEGIKDPEGNRIGADWEHVDKFGNPLLSGALVAKRLTDALERDESVKRLRADVFGYLQRSFPGCVSEGDRFEAREVAERAVQYAVWHNLDGSVAIRRIGDYAVEYFLTPLETVAKKSRHMPDEFISASGSDVTEAFRAYVKPLVGPLPRMERIAAPAVPAKP